MLKRSEKPIIELRGIKVHRGLSEETQAFTATLVVDGEAWGTLSNHGQGGPDNFHGKARNWKDLAALDERVKATFPQIDCTTFGGRGMMETSLEVVCGEIVEAYLQEADLRRLLRAAVLELRGGKIYRCALKQKGRLFPAAEVIETIRKARPGSAFLNEMPFDQAMRFYKASAS